MMKNDWAILFKFGEKQHIQQFREEGVLYMNSIAYFRKRDAQLSASQKDCFEGVDEIVQPQDLKSFTVTCPDRKFVLGPKHFGNPIRISFGKTPLSNIFCMFALTDPKPSQIADPKNFDFGDAFVMVLDTNEFIQRVTQAASIAGCSIDYRLVEYFDGNAYSGKTGPFSKASHFRYQNEFRFVLSPGKENPIQLQVGNLSDITTNIFPLTSINDLIKLQPNEENTPSV